MIKNGEISLPGTLSYPETGDRLPLVIFVHGSGNVDRNGNQAGMNIKANYIKILSDSLNHRGIAFFRYDKRTSNPENRVKMILGNMVYESLVDDLKKVVDHFKDDERFSKIVLTGHSQGSLTAMLAMSDAVDKYISLAGPGESMDKAVIRQISAQNKDLGEKAREHFEELAKTDTIQEVHPFLVALFAPVNHRFIKSYSAYDPVKVMKGLRIPALIINGDTDLQVRVEDAKMLHAARPGSQLIIIPKMNHVLKEVDNIKENQQSYYDENYPLSAALVKAINGFIKQ